MNLDPELIAADWIGAPPVAQEMPGPWPIRSARLEVRPATRQDLPQIWAYRRLPEVASWMTSAWPGGWAEFEAYYLRPDCLSVTLVVELPEAEARVIGDLMVRVGDAWAQKEVSAGARGSVAEIGWCLAPDSQGQGYAEEAVRQVITYAFGTLGVRRVVAELFADNLPSRRLCERLGMRLEAHMRADSLHRDLGWVDGLGFALLESEWSGADPQRADSTRRSPDA